MRKLLLVLVLFFLNTVLSAQNLVDNTKHYTPYKTSWHLGIGGTYPHYFKISDPLIASHKNYGLNLSLGYNLTEYIGLRLFGNVLAMKNNYFQNEKEISNKITMSTINLDIVYTLLACDQLTPYLTAGYGFTAFNFSNPFIDGYKGEIKKDPDGLWTGGQLRLGAGLEYRMFNDFSIITEINYTTASNNKIDGNDTKNQVKGILQSNGDSYMTADLGVRWYFSKGDTSKICNCEGIKTIIDTVSQIIRVTNTHTVKIPTFPPIYFEFDKYNLHPQARMTLDYIIKNLKKYPNAKINISGHTDSIGSEKYNLILSKKRAQTVFDYLVKHGVSPKKIKASWFGELKPVKPNNSAFNRAYNRRVEPKTK